jgi:hypothetical protein
MFVCFKRLSVFAAFTWAIVSLQNAAAAQETFTVVERAAPVMDMVDTGKTGDSPGDSFAFANEIYDQANEKLLGHDNGWCIRTVAGKSWECFWTLMLNDGQITVEGPFLDAGDSVLAVTGGTGAYAGVRGEMKLHARNDKGTEYDFVYNLSR